MIKYINKEVMAKANALTSNQRQQFYYLCFKGILIGLSRTNYEVFQLTASLNLDFDSILDLLDLFTEITELFMQPSRSVRNLKQILMDAGSSRTFLKDLPFKLVGRDTHEDSLDSSSDEDY